MIPSFLYSSSIKNGFDIDHLMANKRSLFDSETSRGFVVQAPSEPGKIEMFSPAYYAACTVGGTLACGLTHTAVTPLDVVKCNMQVS